MIPDEILRIVRDAAPGDIRHYPRFLAVIVPSTEQEPVPKEKKSGDSPDHATRVRPLSFELIQYCMAEFVDFLSMSCGGATTIGERDLDTGRGAINGAYLPPGVKVLAKNILKEPIEIILAYVEEHRFNEQLVRDFSALVVKWGQKLHQKEMAIWVDESFLTIAIPPY